MKEEMNFIEEQYYKIWLTLIQELGVKRYNNLLSKFKTNKGIFYANKSELLKINGIGEKMADKISNIETKRKVKNYLKFMQMNLISIISINDKEYPSKLREIYNPPIGIYVKGNKKILNNTNIGIVGCRECSEYGKNIAQKFAYDLAKNNANIVSGLAIGIDSNAHIGALYAKGYTTAVLGSGLDSIYPKENTFLANKIIENKGAIISEYPLGTKATRLNFPARNRIISGISKGILVVEAKRKSGTLITVDFALEQGRDVFVIPGNINSKNSEGTNDLIKQGAKLVT